ncbi:MAG: sigma-54-dependent Fis family transcriptional regulator [Candidatus Zixiibacteriota bacterium]|nr:MAG: sigma-54-dependent Fis family transcriptional regulator [candidate division Zixibacteria bacterium]
MVTVGKILIVDDDPLVLEALNQAFMDDYDVALAPSGSEAIEIIRSNGNIETVVLDIRMAGMDGLETAAEIIKINPGLPVIFHTGYPGDYSETEIDQAHKPFDYIVKNERPSRLQRAVKNAVAFYRLKSSSAEMARIAKEEFGMIGKSPAMLEVYQRIEKIAPSDNKVMILGPTGTGKELVARAIHKKSRRSGRRLAIFNCNHKAPDLVESELFGHLRGSFTGAVADRIGLFEYADGGTVFLDEIGDLDITTQAKILRVLESGEINRVGSPETIRVDVRLICATHRDISKMVAQEKFRDDLFYRINGITITLPPLKKRSEDIPDLVNRFLENYAMASGGGIRVFESKAMDLLIAYEWPGNVRQLMDTVQSLAALTPSSFITKDEVARYLSLQESRPDGRMSFQERVKDFKRILIVQVLTRNGNNVSAAARELSLDPSNLHKMLKEIDIDPG